MPRTYRYWRTDGNLHPAPPGIRVVHDDTDGHHIANPATGGADHQPFPADFSAAVRDNLNYLHQTAVGQTLLHQLTITAHRPTIQPAFHGNAIQFLGNTGMKPAALELHRLHPGDATRNAVRAMIHHQPFVLGCDIVARTVRSTARWTLDSRPGHFDVARASWSDIIGQGKVGDYAQHLRDRFYQKVFGWDTNEGYSQAQTWVSTERGVAQRGPYVTRDEILEWLVGRMGLPSRLSQDDRRHVANVTISVIYPHAGNGGGVHGAIEWRHQRNWDLNARRPPAIGLAHELIHAYYGSLGRNPGHHDSPPSLILFEYLCVGLGPFTTEPVTENRVRAQWPGVVAGIPVQDAQNRRTPGQRISYL